MLCFPQASRGSDAAGPWATRSGEGVGSVPSLPGKTVLTRFQSQIPPSPLCLLSWLLPDAAT